MALLKSAAKVSGAALVLLLLNGWINYSLMKPLAGVPEPLDRLRVHLDDAAFVMLFAFVAVVFWAMFAVLPRERGYLYLGLISLLTSIQLLWDWDDKKLLFGPFPELPHGSSLAVKSGVTFLAFSFVAYLLQSGHRPITRILLWSGGLLWSASIVALALPAGMLPFSVLNRLFLVHVFLNMALCIVQFTALFRRGEHRAELRFMAFGFVLFAVVLLPDPVKDLLEVIAGRGLGYRPVFWEQCLEDTFPWALLALLTVFGAVFFRRFVRTLQINRAVSDELRGKNETLALEVETRSRMDRLLSAMLQTYRAADWEKCVIREGRHYFRPHRFVLVKYDPTNGDVVLEGADGGSSPAGDIGKTLGQQRDRTPSGEAIVTASAVFGSAGGTDRMRLYLAVYAEDGGHVRLEDRDMFALLLMSKYVSIFYEYFQLLEARLKEIEQRQAERAPWLSRLFVQMAEKERKRLASDLHDEVLQELLHIRRLLDRTPAGQWTEEDKERIRLGLDNAEFMIRETCRELMPSFLSDHGVLHAISSLVERTRLRADFQLSYRAEPPSAALGDEKATVVYRVVQELIHNAMKHSEANRVTLEVGQRGGSVHIRYEDDGKGMEADADFSATNRFGLRGIAERIHMVGGEWSMQSAPGQGVRFHCTVPV